MHKALEAAFSSEPRVRFLYFHTVFEGFATNSFENGLKSLEKHAIKSAYAHDPGDPARRQPSSVMAGYHTRGTPWTIIVGPDGVVDFSAFTPAAPEDLIEIVRRALARIPDANGGSGDPGNGGR